MATVERYDVLVLGGGDVGLEFAQPMRRFLIVAGIIGLKLASPT